MKTISKPFLTALLVAVSMLIGAAMGAMLPKAHAVEDTAIAVDESPLSDWQVMQLAIIKTESEYIPTRVGKTNDVGIMQITPIYVKEANRLAGEERWNTVDCFDPEKSLAMFRLMQERKNPERDITKAIYLHNPKGDSIGYSAKVLRNMDCIRRYEEMRQLIKH